MPSAGLQRLHSLDALRAAMMLLGLVLHSAVSYITTPLGAAWPYQDPQTNVIFDLLVFFIHLFRMPVFFVVAGLFAALLLDREGRGGFVRNRARRVLIPLVMFWAVLLPLCGYGFVFSARQVGGPMPWEYMTDRSMLRQPILGHLWFLYYLLLFYAAALVIMPLAARAPEALRARVDAMVRDIVAKRWGVVVMGIITALTLAPMTAPGLDTEPALLPPARVLLAYGVFFGFGWLLLRHQDLLQSFADRWKRMLIAGAAAGGAYLFVAIQQTGFDDARIWHLTAIAFAGPATWLVIFGMLGVFVRYLSAPRPLVRYFSDASYWMYLTHLVPAAWLPGVFAHLAVPAVVKFLLVFGFTTLSTAVTYHYFVRSTAIGELLNGRRYPRRPSARLAPVISRAAPPPV